MFRIAIICVGLLSTGAAQAATVLITGSNRGIGLELVKQYAAQNWAVIATARSLTDSADLTALAKAHANIRLEALDVTDFAAIDALARRLEGTAIDVLINNAGILGGDPATQKIGAIDYAAMELVHRTNAIAPMKMAEAFLPHVAASEQKKIVVITSGTASLTNVKPSQFFVPLYSYRMSKTAINMGYRALATELAPRGIFVGILAPGMVETRLLRQAGSGGRGIDAATSVKGVIKNIANLNAATSGQYIIHTGDTVPW
ncbi:MAG: SDR family oxidoreductase [Rhodospirillaceae bacterium]|nr:SDR family oxidoreductase [Rhodospirillaceae bacterium]